MKSPSLQGWSSLLSCGSWHPGLRAIKENKVTQWEETTGGQASLLSYKGHDSDYKSQLWVLRCVVASCLHREQKGILKGKKEAQELLYFLYEQNNETVINSGQCIFCAKELFTKMQKTPRDRKAFW